MVSSLPRFIGAALNWGSMELDERVAIVTGASSGVGEATARTLAQRGCSVVLAARRENRLRSIVQDIGDDIARAVPTDVTSEDEVDSLIDRTVEVFGQLDILVNNAGVLMPDPLAHADRAELRRQVEVNLLGVISVTHAALPELLDSGGGDVVAVSSMNARYPAESGSAYTSAKFGVNGFCGALRKEVAEEGIRVTTVMPGPVKTEMRDWEEWDGRALDPGDVAEAIVFAVTRPSHVTVPELPVSATDMVF